MIYTASTWVLPVIIAVTFHEAAHGYVARVLGDNTASRLGRVTLNPLKHIDPFGTIILPGLLLLAGSPFLFGYARPVPVSFRALREPRIGMAMVAAAGPVTNIALALIAALMFHFAGLLPPSLGEWVFTNLKNALVLNVFLAIFNLFPIPPLDGGRIAVALLPQAIGRKLAQLEPYGLVLLIGLLFVVPFIGRQTGIDLGVAWHALRVITSTTIDFILKLTGHS